MAHTYYVYILSNNYGTTLYTGVTNNLYRRLAEHRSHADPNSFTAKYNVHKLVWFEYTENVEAAIAREKQIKGWNRARKIKLITQKNPYWKDLSEEWEQPENSPF